MIKVRDVLVQTRTRLNSHVRAVVKYSGERLPGCSADSFAKRVVDLLPESFSAVLMPLVDTIACTTRQIRQIDKQIQAMALDRYPETRKLEQFSGVGPVTAADFLHRPKNRWPLGVRNSDSSTFRRILPCTEPKAGFKNRVWMEV